MEKGKENVGVAILIEVLFADMGYRSKNLTPAQKTSVEGASTR